MENNNNLKNLIKTKIAISKFNEKNSKKFSSKTLIYKKTIVASICLILTSSIVFAKEINNYLKQLFNNSNKAIESAIDNNYVQTENMNYIYDNNIGIKLDNLILDNLNLNILINFNTNQKNIKSIRFKDFILTTENDSTIFNSEFEFKDSPEELPLYDSFTWINNPTQINENTFIDSILFGLKTDHEQFNEIKFNIKSLDIIYNDDSQEVINGNWKFNIKINDTMKNNSTVTYIMQEPNQYIKTCKLTISKTGSVLELTTHKKIPDVLFISDYISLKSENNLTYNANYTDKGDYILKTHFEELGTYVDNSNQYQLTLDFFKITIPLTKEIIK